MSNKILVLMFLLLAFAIAGCSGESSVTLPGSDELSDSLPGAGLAATNDSFNALGIFGAYELSINDNEIQSAEIIAKRTSSLGESYIVNGISYFTIAICTDCLKIKSIGYTNEGLIQLTFAIRHPFEPGDPLKPPTCINRLDLDVFDLALLVQPIETTPDAFTLTSASLYSSIVANSSGYTTELGNAIEDSSALPFVLVIDDNTAVTDTFNKFEMGAEVEFDVLFDIVGNCNFNLYLTMAYGWSATKSERLTPTYYNPEFNRKSAWKVVVTPPNGDNAPDITNTWNAGDNTVAFDVTVEVFDWQIGANVNPDLENTDDVYAASEVTSVSLEIPGMNSSLVSVSTPDSGVGTPDNPLVYTLSTANENLLPESEYTGLVKVSDGRIPGSVLFGGETDTMADSPDGIILNWVAIPEFATYQTFTASVVVGITCDPVENVTLTVNRLPASGDHAVSDSGPFTLEWAEPLLVPEEYAIYVDIDPSDGLMNDFTFVGTTTGLTFTDTITPLPADHYVAGWTYIVRSRAELGNQASEVTDSEPAHVRLASWETLSNYAVPGMMNDGEGWLGNHEGISGGGASNYAWPRARNWAYAHPAYGSFTCELSRLVGTGQYVNYAGRWNGILMETPVVPDSTVRFVGFVIRGYQCAQQSGTIIGTSPAHMFEAFDLTTFDWAESASHGNFEAYDYDSSEIQTTAEDVPDGINNCWHDSISTTYAHHELNGGDCNNGGNPDDPYIGIELVRITGENPQPFVNLDEVSVAIY